MYLFDPKVALTELQKDFPRVDRVFVKNANIGTDYVSGSVGQVLREEFYDEDDTLRATITYKYKDSDVPTKWTQVITDIKEV